MSNPASMIIAVGDDVRVHFHPPLPVRSFVEGTVSRVDETIPHGPLIVVDVSLQVILGKDAPIRRGHQEYILSGSWNDFPDQIEVLRQTLPTDQAPLSTLGQEVEENARHASIEHQQGIPEQLDRRSEHRENDRRSGFLAAFFGRSR